jgi:hypothetical protein
MDGIQNLKMVEAARTEARALLAHDPTLSSVPLIKERVNGLQTKIHFE